jgi:hypothetical protein
VLPPVDFESTASTNSATPAAGLALPRRGPGGQVVLSAISVFHSVLARGTGIPYSSDCLNKHPRGGQISYTAPCLCRSSPASSVPGQASPARGRSRNAAACRKTQRPWERCRHLAGSGPGHTIPGIPVKNMAGYTSTTERKRADFQVLQRDSHTTSPGTALYPAHRECFSLAMSGPPPGAAWPHRNHSTTTHFRKVPDPLVKWLAAPKKNPPAVFGIGWFEATGNGEWRGNGGGNG